MKGQIFYVEQLNKHVGFRMFTRIGGDKHRLEDLNLNTVPMLTLMNQYAW